MKFAWYTDKNNSSRSNVSVLRHSEGSPTCTIKPDIRDPAV